MFKRTYLLLANISSVPKNNVIKDIPTKEHNKKIFKKMFEKLEILMNMPSTWAIRKITVVAMKKILSFCIVMNCTELQKESGNVLIFVPK